MPHDRIAPYVSPLVPAPTGLSSFGRPPAPLGAVIFDVYGTLFISGSGDIGAANPDAPPNQRAADLLVRNGIEKSPEAVQSAMVRAIRAEHEARQNQGVDYPEVIIEKIWHSILPFSDLEAARDFAMEYEMIVNPVYPMPGALSVITHCRRAEIPMGIVSNAQFFTPMLFEHFWNGRPEALGFFPELIVYSYSHGQAKPSQTLFDQLCRGLERCSIDPASALYIGNDMKKDVLPAKAAGLTTALFAGDKRSLRLHGHSPNNHPFPANMVITDWTHLMAAIERH